jgi:hypothetical protein
VVLRHLSLKSGFFAPDGGLLSILDCAGTVIVEDCEIGAPFSLSAPNTPGLLVDGSVNVSVARSQIDGGFGFSGDQLGFGPVTCGNHGVEVTDSRLTLNGVAIAGGSGGNNQSASSPQPGGDGGDGLTMTDSEVWLIGSRVLGGNIGLGVPNGISAAAIHVDGASSVLRELNSDFIGGLGAAAIEFLAGTQISWAGEAVTLQVSSLRVPGQTGNVQVDGPGNTLFSFFVSFGPGFVPVENLHGVLTTSLSTFSGPLFIATIPPSGHFDLNFPVPAIKGLEGFLMVDQVISSQGSAGLVLSNASTSVQLESPVPFSSEEPISRPAPSVGVQSNLSP